MEGERFADMFIPVVPVVRAGELAVFVGDFQAVQIGVQAAVVFHQEIFRAAVDEKLGELFSGLGALG